MLEFMWINNGANASTLSSLGISAIKIVLFVCEFEAPELGKNREGNIKSRSRNIQKR